MSVSGTTVDRQAAEVVSWQERLAAGSVEAALGSYLRFGPEQPGVQATLEDLQSVVALVKSKAFVRAERVLLRIEDRPDWFDWTRFEQAFAALRKAVAALDERELEQVEPHLQEAEHELFLAEIANIRGTARIFDGELEQARLDFELALELDPKHYRALTNLGNAALEDGRLDEAIEYYRKAINLNADFPNAHHNLGVAWRKKGNIAKSIAALKAGQKAQQKFDQAEAREQLGSMTRKVTGGNAGKYLKWVLYAGIAAGVYWFLSSRGTI